jgi:ribosome-associated heat shock protein Hsp15
VDRVRVDRWVWAVRLSPSRTAATAACRAGHVRVNGATAKPSTTVAVGDRVEVRAGGRDRVVEVVRVIETRVGAAVAVGCYLDHTPAREAEPEPVARRERGAGRPTKRDRRRLDRWRGA